MSKVRTVLFAAVAAVLSSCGFAATTWTWTGGANDGGKWSTPANWGKESGHPSTAEDKVEFSAAAPATVLLDCGETTINTITLAAGCGEVTINATEGSFFHRPDVGGIAIFVTANDGTVLHLNAPLYTATGSIGSTRVDKQNGGTVYFSSTYSNRSSSATYLCAGTNVITGELYSEKKTIIGLNSAYKGKPVSVQLRDSGRMIASGGLDFGGNGNAGYTDFLIDGEGASLQVLSGGVTMGACAQDGFPAHRFTQNRGTFESDSVYVGKSQPADYVQNGGTATPGAVTVYAGSSLTLNGGTFTSTSLKLLSGGSLALNGGTFAPGKLTVPDGMVLSLNGCEFVCVKDANAIPLTVAGASRLTYADDVTLSSGVLTHVAEGTDLSFNVAAGKTVSIDTDLIVAGGGLTVESGTVLLKKGRRIDNVPGCGKTFKLTVKSGAAFVMEDMTARILSPLDLVVEDGGSFTFTKTASQYNVVVARSATLAGVPCAKGRYAAGTSGTLVTKGASYLIIPYVWSGGGDGTTFGNDANWEGGVAPSGTDAYADISDADGEIVLGANVSLGGIVANPSCGARSVKLTGSGTLTFQMPTSTDFTTHVFTGAGREFVIDVKLARSDKRYVGFCGGGRFTFTKYVQDDANNNSKDSIPFVALDGDSVHSNVTAFAFATANQDVCFQGLGVAGFSRVVFGAGTELSFSDFIYSKGGWGGQCVAEYRQDGANLTCKRFLVNRSGSGYSSPTCYFLESGSITATTTFALDGNAYADSSWRRRHNAHFQMTGGTVTTPEMTSERILNYYCLYGGDLYLGAGGFTFTENTDTWQADDNAYLNKYPSLQFGGVALHATASFPVKLDTVFTGIGGATVIDTGANDITYDAASACKISGNGGFVKRGTGTFILDGDCSFGGSVSVESGTVAFADGATVAVTLDALKLAAADSLRLSAGQTLAVGTLVVAGAARAAGDYTDFGGTVTVTGDGPSVWTGASSGGSWNAAANWSSGVPDGETDGADFSLASLSDAATVELGSGVTVTNLTVGAQSLILSGTSLTLPADSAISIAKGGTLTVDADLVVQGYVHVRGGGRLVLKGTVRNPEGKSVATGFKYRLYVDAGTEIEYLGTNHQVATYAMTGDALKSSGLSRMIVGAGADVRVATWPAANDSADGRGGEVVVGPNGTLTLVGNINTGNMANVPHRCEDLTVKGGTLVVEGQPIWSGKKRIGITLEDCTVSAAASSKLFPDGFDLRIGGELTFVQGDAAVRTELSSAFDGACTKLTQSGPGTLALTGSRSPAQNLAVASGAKVELAFAGTNVVTSLELGGKPRRAGTYSATEAPAARDAAYFAGEGTLEVLTGNPPGLLLIVR